MWAWLQEETGRPDKYVLLVTNHALFWHLRTTSQSLVRVSWKPLAKKCVLQVALSQRRLAAYRTKEFENSLEAAKEALVAAHLSKYSIFPRFGSLSAYSFSMKNFPTDLFHFCLENPTKPELARVLLQTTACVAALVPKARVFMLDLKPSNVVVNAREVRLIDGDPEFVIFLERKTALDTTHVMSAASLVLYYLQFWGHAGLLFDSQETVRFYRERLRAFVLTGLRGAPKPAPKKAVLEFLASLACQMHGVERATVKRRRSPLCTVFCYVLKPGMRVRESFLSEQQQTLFGEIRQAWLYSDATWGPGNEEQARLLFQKLLLLTGLDF